jgi:hypothetical protein
VALALGAWFLGSQAGDWLSKERAFVSRAQEVPARVAAVTLPPTGQRDGASASLKVLYEFGGKAQTATVEASALEWEGRGPGVTTTLLVDPSSPSRPREASLARQRAGWQWLGWLGLGLGVLLALVLGGLEARRALRRELAPLRDGMLVWLTPDTELPQTRAELVFPASYYRDDVKYVVQARARPGRAPVRNGAKLLAAVVPSQPRWVRVIDEDLARALGWFVD